MTGSDISYVCGCHCQVTSHPKWTLIVSGQEMIPLINIDWGSSIDLWQNSDNTHMLSNLKKNTHQRINIVFFQRHVAFPCFLFLFFFLQQCCGFICFYKMANTTRSVRLTTFNRKCKEIVNDQLWEGLSRPESKSAFIILIRTQKQKLSILFYV